jgi:hypothetical protein
LGDDIAFNGDGMITCFFIPRSKSAGNRVTAAEIGRGMSPRLCHG